MFFVKNAVCKYDEEQECDQFTFWLHGSEREQVMLNNVSDKRPLNPGSCSVGHCVLIGQVQYLCLTQFQNVYPY